MAPRKQPSQRRAIETRVRILDAAEAMIDETGNSDFSMNALRLRAGVSAGGLYEWFQNKEEVLDGVMERHVDVATTAIDALMAQVSALPLSEKVQRVLQLGLAMHQARPVFHQFLFSRAARSPEVQAKLDGFDRAMEKVIQQELEQAGEDTVDATLKAAIINRAGQSLLHEFVLDEQLPGDADARLSLLVEQLMVIA